MLSPQKAAKTKNTSSSSTSNRKTRVLIGGGITMIAIFLLFNIAFLSTRQHPPSIQFADREPIDNNVDSVVGSVLNSMQINAASSNPASNLEPSNPELSNPSILESNLESSNPQPSILKSDLESSNPNPSDPQSSNPDPSIPESNRESSNPKLADPESNPQRNPESIPESNHKTDGMDANSTRGNILSFLSNPYIRDEVIRGRSSKHETLSAMENIITQGFKYFVISPDERKITFCVSVGAGLGNTLSIYYIARAYAFWLGYDFEMTFEYVKRCADPNSAKDTNNQFVRNQFEKFDQPMHSFSSYLPKTTNYTIVDYIASNVDDLDLRKSLRYYTQNVLQWMYQTPIDLRGGQQLYPYKSDFLWVWCNPVFIDVYRSEIKSALNAFYNQFPHIIATIKEKNANIDEKGLITELERLEMETEDTHWFKIFSLSGVKIADRIVKHYTDPEYMKGLYFDQPSMQSDVVIHYRCGDIISIGNGDYGLMTRQFYEDSAKHFKKELTSQSRVILLSQLSETSIRPLENKGKTESVADKCTQIVYGLVAHLREVFKPATLIISGNGTVNDDFLRMSRAPTLICGYSSFCLIGGLANPNRVIFPNVGPWEDLRRVETVGKGADSILPPNMILMDTKKHPEYVLPSPDMVGRRKAPFRAAMTVEEIINVVTK